MGLRFVRLVRLGGCAIAVAQSVAHAAGRRPFFEPQDSEVEVVGSLEVNVQTGASVVPGRTTLYYPDLEAELGIAERVELGLDATLASGSNEELFGTTRTNATDHLWPHLKVLVADAPASAAWPSVSLQLGPRVPIVGGYRGVGVEALLIADRAFGGLEVALNAGAFRDPRERGEIAVAGANAGIDVEWKAGAWSAVGEVGGTKYTSEPSHELNATLGFLHRFAHVSLGTQAAVLCASGSGCGPAAFLSASSKFGLW